jgi:hypothetical protein
MVELATIQDIERLLEAQKAEIISAINEKLKGGESTSNSKWIRTYHSSGMDDKLTDTRS